MIFKLSHFATGSGLHLGSSARRCPLPGTVHIFGGVVQFGYVPIVPGGHTFGGGSLLSSRLPHTAIMANSPALAE